MSYFQDKVVVVTGAASGIGRGLALGLARRGARLAISDIDTAGLVETADLARYAGADVFADALDVSQRELIAEHAARVVEHYGVVHQVYNNAGVAYTGTVEEMDDESLERLIDVDFWGVANGTKIFLPHLIASGDGHVVNISSVFGLFSVPGQSAYNAAKFAVRGYTEALAVEMRQNSHPVKVTCVLPGGVRTNIARNGDQAVGRDHEEIVKGFDKLARTSPHKAAETILRGVERRRSRVLVGTDAKLLDVAIRLLGPRYQGLVARLASGL